MPWCRGRVPAVMVHVSVGTANAVCGVINAARENVPILFTAGRTPLTESGLPGARDVYIHWAQEMFDQAGMLREIVKWDYELRNGQQLETVVDRALAIAATEPRGPGLSVIAARGAGGADAGFAYDAPARRVAAAPPGPDKGAIEEAARILAAAENPLIITANAGRDRRRSRHSPLSRSASPSRWCSTARATCRCPPTIPCISAIDPTPYLRGRRRDPRPRMRRAMDPEPRRADGRSARSSISASIRCSQRYPIRGFPCDLAITGAAARRCRSSARRSTGMATAGRCRRAPAAGRRAARSAARRLAEDRARGRRRSAQSTRPG